MGSETDWNYIYWLAILLMLVGLYGMLLKGNLMRKLIAMTIFQTAIILFFITGAMRFGATIPILEDPTGAGLYVNALPHAMMLTAIVVGVASQGLGLAMLLRIQRRYRTLDEHAVLERMRPSS